MSLDIIIIGGGHNGLVCASYLARAGRKVRILERAPVVGGAAITEEFHPGFRNSVASYTVSLLNPKIISDLDLYRHGLKIVERKVNNLWPNDSGDFIAFPAGSEALKAELARYSRADADALERYNRDTGMVADLIRDYLLKTPPNAGGGLRDLFRMAGFANRLRKLPLEDERIVMDIFTKSVADFLALYFENDFVRGAFAFDGLVGNYADTRTPGSAYVLMHHAFGEVNGKKGLWGHAIGGMGAITQAMAAAARERGVQIEVNREVEQVLVENGRAVGVQLADGETVRARAVVSNVNPSLLYGRLVDPAELPAEFSRRIRQYRNGSGTFRMNVALDSLPRFSCLQQQARATEDHLTGGIVIGPTMDYLDKSYRDAREHGWSREPLVEMLIPSLLDDSLAPPGQHVASLFCQQFDPDVDWDQHRDAAAEQILDQVEKYAPGFKQSIVGKQVLSPLDLERKFGLTRGDIMHGALSIDQMFSARPMLGHGDYRGPISGLYMCGAGTHPGGGVTGAPGHNAAREILRDV
ncbi:NAD(P)/FAD-dependent oxidoreductase [Seongchinamella unica]|uniref:Pyridine nucleotide-disulfide oxidoreductase domain-containing protein 2 n=1 Tax=Seongchinamella unica TaxID=2547392 RepID=A0A4R5LVN0_9GAMM|nr:NAD(P)/FAD-dependent oxidoreductase [Seongchinamella unica]TDG15470.1 NAD(P)/FAD-dependent oxidoreductase [Seongchinamella unica]